MDQRFAVVPCLRYCGDKELRRVAPTLDVFSAEARRYAINSDIYGRAVSLVEPGNWSHHGSPGFWTSGRGGQLVFASLLTRTANRIGLPSPDLLILDQYVLFLSPNFNVVAKLSTELSTDGVCLICVYECVTVSESVSKLLESLAYRSSPVCEVSKLGV